MAQTAHTLELLVEETRQEMDAVEADLAQTRARLAALQEKANVLREEHASFLAALRRRVPESEVVTDQVTADDRNEEARWIFMPRTDAVVKALAAVEPASPADVQAYLSERGRDDGRDLISAALAHLKRSGRVWRLGYSQWTSTPPPKNAESPADTGLSGDVTATGEGVMPYAQAGQDQDHPSQGRIRDRGGDPAIGEISF